ncbi:ribonuclease P protein component [Methylocaldum szegediense]|uniref:Ribonuclease P protein component n=1 Tax=Methylocaldum szegediense TaxID=73780 RepID=A0ABM9I4C0_9GAMM|nr:ribonuclease P protein component [Methylocaldum szegediense]CAI8884275.1 RNase P protein component [Methylocaldum szegediense]
MASPRYGFPRTRRLSSAADFQRVFEQPCKSADQYLTVLARTNGRDYPRLGLAIARRQIRNAADRNRIKRIIRESFRLRQPLLGGIDFVVMARSAASQADHETLRRSLHKHWENLVRRCKPSWSSSSDSIST